MIGMRVEVVSITPQGQVFVRGVVAHQNTDGLTMFVQFDTPTEIEGCVWPGMYAIPWFGHGAYRFGALAPTFRPLSVLELMAEAAQ